MWAHGSCLFLAFAAEGEDRELTVYARENFHTKAKLAKNGKKTNFAARLHELAFVIS